MSALQMIGLDEGPEFRYHARRSEAEEAVAAWIACGFTPTEAVRKARRPIRAAQRARVIHLAELQAQASLH
jgi:hypothetical protein